MNTTQLKPGDLIFTMNSLGEAEHLALYAGAKDGVPYVLHATSAPHNAIMLTHLKEADIACEYRVMRAINETLSLEAKQILLGWVEYQVPYASTEKLDLLLNAVDKMGGLDNPSQSASIQELYGKKTYVSSYSQYLLMLNCLPFIPVVKLGDDSLEGLRCAEAIVAAFNIALLMMHAVQQDDKWVIQTTLDADLNASLGHVSILNDFIELIDSPLPFDANTAMSNGVYYHCIKSSSQWENLDVLTVLPCPEPDEACKADWRSFKSSLKKAAIDNTSHFLQSPKGSIDSQDISQYVIPRSCSNESLPVPFSPRNSRTRSTSTCSPELRRSPFYSTFFMEEPNDLPIMNGAKEQSCLKYK